MQTHCCANCSTVSSDLIPLDSAQSKALVQLFQIQKSEDYLLSIGIGTTGSTTYLCPSCFQQVQDVLTSIHKLTALWVKNEDTSRRRRSRGQSIFHILRERSLNLEFCWSKLEPEDVQPTDLPGTSSLERKPLKMDPEPDRFDFDEFEDFMELEDDSLLQELLVHESSNDFGTNVLTPRTTQIPKTINLNKKHDKEKNSVLVPNILTVSGSQRSCFICGTNKGKCRSLVTTKTRLQIWKSKQIYVPPANRNCKTHLNPETGEINDKDLELVVPKIRKTVEILRNDQLISLVYNPKALVNGLIQEAMERDCFVELGLRCDDPEFKPAQNHHHQDPPALIQSIQLRNRKITLTSNTNPTSSCNVSDDTSGSEFDCSEDEDDETGTEVVRKTFNCQTEHCFFSTTQKNQFIQHLNQIHEIPISETDNYFEDTQSKVVRPILNCPTEDCFYSTHTKSQFKQHLNQIHAVAINKIEVCKVCFTVFTDRKEYKEHYNSHAGERGVISCMEKDCEHEKSAFLSNDDLRSHRIKVHGQVELATNSQTPATCPQCNKTLSTLAKLRNHIAALHPEKPLERNIICELCGRKFATSDHLRDHQRDCHVPESAKISCPHPGCSYKATTKARLNHHMVKHSEERTIQCHMCPRRYKGQGALREHLLSHENQRKWICNTFGANGETCGRISSFNRKLHLVQHIMKIHGLNRRESTEIASRLSSRKDMSNTGSMF